LKIKLCRASGMLAVILLASALAVAGEGRRGLFVLTSTNDASGNNVVVFKLDTGTSSLSWVDTLPTGGKGGAGTNAGALQFRDNLGAVANFGSNTVSQLVRNDAFISVGATINLATGCVQPDSVALTEEHLFVVGRSWAAVTLSSGSLLQLLLTRYGSLNGVSTTIPLPSDADTVPLGAGFWGDILGFTPAHSADNFAIVDKDRNVYPVAFPNPPGPYPVNAPCWVAKGAGNIWYTGNSPGQAITIFFSDGQGGAFYKSIPLAGAPSDITVSADGKWLAVIYVGAADSEAHVAVFAIDAYGDLTAVATSNSVGVAGFNGVAFSQ